MVKGKVNKAFEIILIIIFILVISIPLIFINKDPNKISVVENKNLAKFPSYYTSAGNLNTSFISEFENYISDNIGFKQDLVVADIALEFKIFNKMKVPNFIMGKDENVFYTSGGVGIDTYQGKNILSDDKLIELGQGYSNMQLYFENSGADFYMMTIPDKEAIYPEYFLDEIKSFSSKTRIDLLVDYLHANTNVNVFNMRQALYDNKGKDMLYYKNYDCTHWNMNGAFVGYSEIMKQLKQSFPNIKVLTKDDFNINIVETKGALVHLSTFKSINDAMSLEDKIYDYSLKEGYHAELTSDVPEGITVEANDKFFHYVNKDKSNEPKILIIGDSYIYTFLLPILAESFSELYFTNYTITQEIMDLQNSINADVVLYEFVERVFNQNIYSELMNFDSMETINYTELPVIGDAPLFFIDSPAVENNNILLIDQSLQEQNIYGWSIDLKGECLPKAVYLKVNDKLYNLQHIERPDLATSNEEYLLAGFLFVVPTQEIIDATKLEFNIISGNGEYRYQPIEYNILIK